MRFCCWFWRICCLFSYAKSTLQWAFAWKHRTPLKRATKARTKYMANMAAGAGNTKTAVICRLIYDVECVCVISGSRTPRQRHWMDVVCWRKAASFSIRCTEMRNCFKLSSCSCIHIYLEWSKAAVHLCTQSYRRHTQRREARAWGRSNIISKFQYSIWTHKTEFRNA